MALLLAGAATVGDEHGVLAQHALDDDALEQWRLPGRLREVSGLALTPDERILAVTDEAAIVYEIDVEKARLVKVFALGSPTVRGDFEGIAVLEGLVYLLTSGGVIYQSPEGADGDRVMYRSFNTGLGAYCELEGLATDITDRSLLLLCKETRRRGDVLKLYVWRPDVDRTEYLVEYPLPERDIVDKLAVKSLHPSGIAVDRATGNRLIVAARQAALVELDQDGELIDAIILPEKKKHKQAEGIELTADRRLVIADEGGNGRPRLAIYHPRPAGSEHE